MDKPKYINKNPKPISIEDLLKVLEELHEKHKRDRRDQIEATNKALSDGFRCVPKI